MANEFYTRNNVVFITGATGFVGKTILEKLLRSFPQITKVYLLMRISGSKTLQSRVENDIFSSMIFDTLKSQFSSAEFQEKIVKKIVPVQGDITFDLLGLSDHDLAMIREDVTVIINSAASVSFDDPLNSALEMNTKGPLRTFEVAQGAEKLKAFVHISTCYANAHKTGEYINETIYDHPFGEPEELFKMLTTSSYEEVRNFERSYVLKSYPNTYTFTKSLTEHLIKKRFRDMNLPIVIVRPSIVTSAIEEPVPGWVEGTAAANKAVVSCALGHVQEWVGMINYKTDLIPVDIVAKIILLAATTADRTLDQPPIYHAATSSINPITWRIFGDHLSAYWTSIEKPRRRISDDIRFEMYPLPHFKKRFDARFGEQIRTLGQHKDGKRIKGRIAKAMAVPMTFKAFTSNEWFFDVKNTLAIDETASPELKFDLKSGVEWHKYMEDYCAGVHAFILKEKVNRSIVIDYSDSSIAKANQSGHLGEKEKELAMVAPRL
ncbi:cyclin-dependent kinase inhibitor far1 [Entomortierella beljakovae]|nr:cyclin-dependent kinase inhibitor far1 [Entomortierella beljakovae]